MSFAGFRAGMGGFASAAWQSRAVRAGRSGVGWLGGFNDPRQGMLASMGRLPDYFGFSNRYGGAWTFGGARLGRPPSRMGGNRPTTGGFRSWSQWADTPQNTGRHFIPNHSPQGLSAQTGRFGTFRELIDESHVVRQTTPNGRYIGRGAGVARQARMLGGRAVHPLLAGFFFKQGVEDEMASGESFGEAVGETALGFAKIAIGLRLATAALGPATWPLLAIGGTAVYAAHVRNKKAQYARRVRKTEFSGDMTAFQSQGAVTMRQRSMQSIQRSYLNARSALGSEARYQHLASMQR
tara:strand:- start:37355 stop:38239 length:885 start_codon:yes stop_codon:yes gene_type:complete